MDFDYFEIKKELNLDNSKKLKDYLLFLETGKPIKPDDYEDSSNNAHIVVRNIIDGELDYKKLIYINDEKAKLLKDYRIEKGDIVIAISSDCGHSFYFDGNSDLNLTLSYYLAKLRVDNKKINPIFLNYYINSRKIKKYFRSIETGKTIKNLSKHYIKELPILIPDKPTQDQIVSKIEPIEKQIKELKSQIKDPQEIINQVFAREFGFDENLYKEFGKGMTAGTQIGNDKKLRIFETNFSELARSQILRFSTRFHNPPTKKLMEILNNIETIKVEKILIEKIHRGASPKYDKNGEIPVVKTGHLKNGYIEISEEEFVSEKFYNESQRSQIKKNDILIASTGKVSLGKVDLVETDEKLVVDSHISIIRINPQKYNSLFFVYFFRSILGYFQIERDFTGATNQIELYANEITNFQIPNIPLEDQQKIVDEIKKELDKQQDFKKQIEEKRNKIDEIIKEVVI